VRGRQLDPCRSVRRWCGEKRGPADEPADHALGRSRGGFGTKFHLVTDGKGTPLTAIVTAGQCHDSVTFEETLTAVRVPRKVVGRPRRLPNAVAGDKAYSCQRIRTWLRKRNVERVIPQKDDQVGHRGGHRVFDKAKYRQRCVIEQCVGWLKEARRVLTRFEKLAVNYLAMLKLAFVDRYLRILA
jgi:transposase